MELPVRLPVLPAQCYSPSPDHGFDGRRAVSSTTRQPLQESTGNTQHPHMAWYAQHLDSMSSIPSSVPPMIPPVLRTQSLGPDYGGAPAYSRSQHRHELQQLHGRRRQQGTNPIMPLLSQAFQNYRKKQADKNDQKWPEELEGHFLDALLLIPQMGRNKYTMKQTLFGRNQLIGEYLWLASCQNLGPGEELDPQIMEMLQSDNIRKKVSSHTQVLKNFFHTHRCSHFLFGERPEDKEKDTIEKVSLKNNPVLIALSEDRLPSERPNYDYFAQILALNEQVQFRPKRGWIFVSHQDVVVGEDGSGYLPGTDSKLSVSEYPHLPRNLERETWAKEEQQLFKGALLHEFTKQMDQVKSGSVRRLSDKWESAFPELHQRLKSITSTTTDARCDILHLHATLELKEQRVFPTGSSLSSWVEINIEQPRLLNHRWKVETRLVRPAELSYSHDEADEDSRREFIHERQKEFTINYQHRPPCDGSRNHGRKLCDCLSQRSRRDGISVPLPVPFPAIAWAQTLTNCAEYLAHPLSDRGRNDRDRGVTVKTEDEHGGPRSRRRTKQPTQMDLVPKIAMMQEIWSCPPTSPQEEGSRDSTDQRWTRRAVILWTFQTVHSMAKKDKGWELVTAPGGKTDWRFLTILDPSSEYHQQHAVISGRRSSADEYRSASGSLACGSRPSSRATVMSPSPTYQQHLNASMSENFAACDNAGGLGSLSSSAAQAAYGAHYISQTMPTHTSANQAGYGLLDSFNSHCGLETPPSSASLAGSFSHSFDTTSTNSDMLPSYMTAHSTVTSGGMDASAHALGGALSAVTDPFLAHVGATYTGQDGIHGWDRHGVSGAIDPAASWGSGYSNPNATHMHSGTAAAWSGAHPQPIPSRRSSEQHQHPHHHHVHHQPRQDRHPWPSAITTKATASGIDDHDPWTPITSANTSNGETNLTRASSHDHHPAHSQHHHQHSDSNSNSNPTVREQNQDWVHIHAASTSTSASAPSTATAGSGADASDLSQDWEEIHTLPTEHSASSPSQSQSSLTAGGEVQGAKRYEKRMGVGAGVVAGVKREREVDDCGGEDGYGDGEGYHRRARLRSH